VLPLWHTSSNSPEKLVDGLKVPVAQPSMDTLFMTDVLLEPRWMMEEFLIEAPPPSILIGSIVALHNFLILQLIIIFCLINYTGCILDVAFT